MTDVFTKRSEKEKHMSAKESQMMKDIFSHADNKGTNNRSQYNILIFGVVFFTLNLPFVTTCLKNMINIPDIGILLIKSIIFIIILYGIQILNK